MPWNVRFAEETYRSTEYLPLEPFQSETGFPMLPTGPRCVSTGLSPALPSASTLCSSSLVFLNLQSDPSKRVLPLVFRLYDVRVRGELQQN